MTRASQILAVEFSLRGGGILPSLIHWSIVGRLAATMGLMLSRNEPSRSVVEIRPLSGMAEEGRSGTGFDGRLMFLLYMRIQSHALL
jgi:hypothetical protein